MQNIVKTITAIQFVVYGWFLFIVYSVSHDSNPTDMDWLTGIVPAGSFVVLGMTNLVCFTVYLVGCIKQKHQPQYLVLVLEALALGLYIFSSTIVGFVESL